MFRKQNLRRSWTKWMFSVEGFNLRIPQPLYTPPSPDDRQPIDHSSLFVSDRRLKNLRMR